MSDPSASYYRAALSAAKKGDLPLAARLVRYSIDIGEDAPNAERLSELLVGRPEADAFGGASDQLRTLIAEKRYKRALSIRLPHTVAAHNARGLLYALLNRNGRALREFALALSIDGGDDLAKRGMIFCGSRTAKRRGLWNPFR